MGVPDLAPHCVWFSRKSPSGSNFCHISHGKETSGDWEPAARCEGLARTQLRTGEVFGLGLCISTERHG
jgi:hypothetical protein